MADELKRVGLILTAEGATDFKKTLQEVNLEINKNYNEFKLAQTQWDESTTKIQKLREQQEYLTNAYELQKDKVNALKMQLADMENEENKNTTAIKKKRTELLNAEVQLKNYNNRLNATTTNLKNAEAGILTTAEKIEILNGKLKENESAFKLTQSQYTAMTSKSQKLKDEQSYLTNAYDLQKEKIELLNSQLKELENAEDKNTSAISKKRDEVIQAETELNNYNTKLKTVTNQLKSLGAKAIEVGIEIENFGSKIEGAGKKLSAFSAAVGSALVACAKSAIDFEDAFTGVTKTVDGTEEQLEEIKQGIINMSKELPSTTTEISEVAEAAGQLGIKTENILSFSKAMIDLGNSTNLTADEAASNLAKFANIMQMSQSDFSKLGSSIVDLGNNFATTEADIVDMAMRLAGAGKQVGLSEGQVLGLATALSSVGIEAEMGGSAISKAMVKMQNAVELGGGKLEDFMNTYSFSLEELELMAANQSKAFKEMAQEIGMTSTELKNMITAGVNLRDFAEVSGMTAEEFKKAWKEDASGALTAFIQGLENAENKGESAITMLSEMGLTEVRLRDSLLRAANAGSLFNDAIQTGTKAWEDNTALTNEANKRYDTLKSKLVITLNKIKALAITFGNKLTPIVDKATEKIENFTKWVENLTDEDVELILKIAGTVVALGPLITIIGKVTSITGGAIKGISTFTQAIGVMTGKVTTTSTAVNGLAKVIGGIVNPAGAMVTAITAISTALWIMGQKSDKSVVKAKEQISVLEEQKETTQELKKAQKEYLDSNLSEINHVSELRSELGKLVDENGKVKEAYKGRVEFILGELNKALGTEYQTTDGVIQKYKELTDSIDEVIEKKKASIILNSMEDSYSNALNERSNAIKNLAELEKTYASDKEKIIEKENEKIELQKGKQSLFTLSRINKLNDEIKVLKENVDAYDKQKSKIIEYNTQISDYETASVIIKEGNIKKIEELNQKYTNSYQTRKDDTISSLAEQLTYEIINLQTQKETYEKTQSEVTANQIEQSQQRLKTLVEELINSTSAVNENSPEIQKAWKDLANSSYTTYYDTISQLPTELANKIQEMTGVVAERTPDLVNETQKMSQQVLDQIEDNEQFRQEAINNLKGMLNGLNDEELSQLLKEAGIQDVNKVMEGIRQGNLAEDEGINILKGLHNGLNNKSWATSLWNTAKGIATKLSGMLNVKATVNGDTSAIPGHKLGLDYVPKDNYIARLHKGERVLTKEENQEYSEAEERAQKSNGAIINTIDYTKMADAMILAINASNSRIEDLLSKILEKNQRIILNTGELIGATADAYDTALANNQTRRERGN